MDRPMLPGTKSPYDAANLSQHKSGGWAQVAPMITGDPSSSPGPQAFFKDEKGNNVARDYTVRFGMMPPADATGDTPLENVVDVIAVIRSSVAGNTIQRKITVRDGVSISGCAEAVDVKLFDITPAFGQTQGIKYQVTAQIALGPRANYTLPPTLEAFTDQVNGIAIVESGVVIVNGGSSAVYPIPQNCGIYAVEVLVVDPNNPSTPPDVLVTIGSPLNQSKRYNPYNEKGYIIIPGNSTMITVFNAGDGVVDVTVTFAIEG